MDKVVTLVFDSKYPGAGVVKQLKSDLQGVGAQAGLSGGQMAALGVGIGAVAGAAVVAGKAALDYGADAVRAAIEEQAATERMNAALRANVAGWDGNTEAIGKRIDAGVRLAFSDDAMRASFTTLVSATKDVNRAFDVQRTAMDLARLKGISLEDASQALVRVEAGQYRALKALGIVLRDGATQTEALAAVQKVAAGQAAAYADTIAGRYEQIGDRLDQFQQSVGGRALPLVDRTTRGMVDLAAATDGAADSQYRAGEGAIRLLAALSQVTGDSSLSAKSLRNMADAVDAMDAAAAGAQAQLDRNRAAWDEYKRAQNEARLGVPAVEGSLRTLRQVVHDGGVAALTAAGRLDAFGDAIDRAAGKAADDAFSVAELMAQFRLGNDVLRDDIARLRELEAIKHPTRAQREDLEQTRLKVIEDKRQLVELEAKMLAAGKVDFETAIARMQDLGVSLYNADGTASDLLKHLRLISGQSGSAQTGIAGVEGRRASGGPVAAGKAYIVGESGAEVFVPDTSGMIVPNAGGGLPATPAAGVGGPLIGQVVFQTLLSPSRAQIAELADLIDRELRSRYPQFSPTPARG